MKKTYKSVLSSILIILIIITMISCDTTSATPNETTADSATTVPEDRTEAETTAVITEPETVTEAETTAVVTEPETVTEAETIVSEETTALPGGSKQQPLSKRNIVTKTPYTKLTTSFSDTENYYYFFKIGEISAMPIAFCDPVRYDGTVGSTLDFSTSVTSVSEIRRNITTSVDNNVTFTLNYSSSSASDGMTPALDIGFSKSNRTTSTDSIETAFSNATASSRAQSFTFGESSEPGFYRYALFAEVDVYGVVIKNIATGNFKTSKYNVIVASYWCLDYSTTARFSDASSPITFDITAEEINDLAIPTIDISENPGELLFEFYYDAKTIDASHEYTLGSPMDITQFAKYMNSRYKITFEVKLHMKEKEAGYQEIYITKTDNSHLTGEYAYEFGESGKAKKTYDWATFNFEIPGNECPSTVLLRVGAHGSGSDDWVTDQAKVTISVKKAN